MFHVYIIKRSLNSLQPTLLNFSTMKVHNQRHMVSNVLNLSRPTVASSPWLTSNDRAGSGTRIERYRLPSRVICCPNMTLSLLDLHTFPSGNRRLQGLLDDNAHRHRCHRYSQKIPIRKIQTNTVLWCAIAPMPITLSAACVGGVAPYRIMYRAPPAYHPRVISLTIAASLSSPGTREIPPHELHRVLYTVNYGTALHICTCVMYRFEFIINETRTEKQTLKRCAPQRTHRRVDRRYTLG